MISALLLAAALGAPKISAQAQAVPVDVDAASIVYDYKKKQTVMTGDPLVTLTREDAKLVCKQITADMDEAGRIAAARCEGDVKLTRGERVVTCARARFESAAGRVTCEGAPVLRDGPSVVEGEVLVYDLDDDRITLTRAKGKVHQQPGQKLPPLATPKGSSR